MKSEHDKRGEARAKWKRLRRNPKPGYTYIKGRDLRGITIVDVFPTPTGAEMITGTLRFRFIDKMVMT